MGGESLVLLHREYSLPILFASGDGEAAARLMAGVEDREVSLQLQEPALAELRRRYVVREKAMWRMVLRREPPAPSIAVARLGAGDAGAIERLYADGAEVGESPDFFFPAMVGSGVFYGVWEGDALVAVAGTHMVVREERAAAIGNVYTHRGSRGRGLAGAVTSAVARELVGGGIETVVLNVVQQNAAAVRVYERLGFVRHCAYAEGSAVRR